MGNESGKEINVVETDSADTAIDVLVDLATLATRLSHMSDQEAAKATATVNAYHGKNAIFHKIVAKQHAIAKPIQQRVAECRQKQTEAIRQRSKVVAHFNDGDGDDIKFTMDKGVCRVFVNGAELPVKLIVANPPLLQFEYTTSAPNKWIWSVNFQSRACEGRSPRTFMDKTLQSVLANDSVAEF